MLVAALILLILISLAFTWILVFRTAIENGQKRVLSHIRGLMFGFVAAAITFVAGGVIVSTATAGAELRTDAKTVQSTEQIRDSSDDQKLRLSLSQIYLDKHFENMESKLADGNTAPLRAIPAKRGASTVAAVLKSRGIMIGRNPDIACGAHFRLAATPGCLLTVYLTRRPRPQQTDLSGVPAHWFMPMGENAFHPVGPWAEFVDQDDDHLSANSLFGYSDNR